LLSASSLLITPFSAQTCLFEVGKPQAVRVESERVITDRDTGRNKGFGFVEMSTEQEAADAITKFDGRF